MYQNRTSGSWVRPSTSACASPYAGSPAIGHAFSSPIRSNTSDTSEPLANGRMLTEPAST
jgi:hypothetical protein